MRFKPIQFFITIMAIASIISNARANAYTIQPEVLLLFYPSQSNAFVINTQSSSYLAKSDYANPIPGKIISRLAAIQKPGSRHKKNSIANKVNTQPWYSSMAAHSIYFSLVVLMIFGFVKFKTIKLRKEKNKLESLLHDYTKFIRRPPLQYSESENNLIKKGQSASTDELFLAKVTETIREHLHEFTFDVTTLQDNMAMSESTLNKKLKNITGESPVRVIRKMRLNKAAAMLENSDMSITEILMSVGFSNPSYFAKCFKKYYGVTPRYYQKSNSNAGEKINNKDPGTKKPSRDLVYKNMT